MIDSDFGHVLICSLSSTLNAVTEFLFFLMFLAIYSQLSLSRTCLSRITAYLEVKI